MNAKDQLLDVLALLRVAEERLTALQPTADAKDRALLDFIQTIEATGGLVHVPGEPGNHGCAGDEDWYDLADAYKAACKAMGRKPKVKEPEYTVTIWEERDRLHIAILADDDCIAGGDWWTTTLDPCSRTASSSAAGI